VLARELGPAAVLFSLPAPRFRTIHLLVGFRQTLDPGTVTRAALLTRVLYRGTGRLPDMTALAGHLEDLYGASLGTATTKLGDQEVLEATFSCAGPAGLRAIGAGPEAGDLPVHGARLLAEVFSDPAREGPGVAGLRPDYVRQEKQALARDIASISDDRAAYAHFRCLAEMCRGEPAALHSLGRAEDLPGITLEDLDAYRRRVLAEAPLAAYLVGPVDDAVVAAVAAEFGELTGGSGGGVRRGIPPSRAHERPRAEREVLEDADVEQARLVVGLHTGVLAADAEAPIQAFYNGLLGGFVHSRLFRVIREEAGLAYYAWSRVLATKGVILISCGIQEKDYERALGLIRRELASLAEGKFSDAEFEATRNSVLAAAKAALDSPAGLVYAHLARLAVGSEAEELAPWRELARVTADQVRAFGPRPVIDTVYLLRRGDKGAEVGRAAERVGWRSVGRAAVGRGADGRGGGVSGRPEGRG